MRLFLYEISTTISRVTLTTMVRGEEEGRLTPDVPTFRGGEPIHGFHRTDREPLLWSV
ncbi:hypothetical protein [Synechococcus sp. M16CYN]|uniref:hypothetical protein n=1 Tax=Synechococcus sp. M16CYN TaxID=3103139 RepID=UPI003340D2F2